MEVIWDSERFEVDLPAEHFTLGSFKRYLSSRTGVATEHMKLFCNAGLMKDDNARLSTFRCEEEDEQEAEGPSYQKRSRLWDGIFSGLRKRQTPPMRIRMVGSTETRAVVSDRPDLKASPTPLPTAHPAAPSHSDPINEPRMTQLINDLVEKTLSDHLANVERYEALASPENHRQPSPSPDRISEGPPVEAAWDSIEFAGLSEMLLQVLLKLDGFEIESEWMAARMARKEGVRAVQKLLDRLDHVKAIRASQR